MPGRPGGHATTPATEAGLARGFATDLLGQALACLPAGSSGETLSHWVTTTYLMRFSRCQRPGFILAQAGLGWFKAVF